MVFDQCEVRWTPLGGFDAFGAADGVPQNGGGIGFPVVQAVQPGVELCVVDEPAGQHFVFCAFDSGDEVVGDGVEPFVAGAPAKENGKLTT